MRAIRARLAFKMNTLGSDSADVSRGFTYKGFAIAWQDDRKIQLRHPLDTQVLVVGPKSARRVTLRLEPVVRRRLQLAAAGCLRLLVRSVRWLRLQELRRPIDR